MHEENKNPWTTTSSEVVYNNPWIQITHNEVIHPSGNPGIYGCIHFHHIAIGVLVLDEHNQTYLVGQFRYPLNHYSWEIPEGGGKPDIPYLESAKRELLEETGICAKKWREITRMHLSNSASDEFAVIFLAQDLEFGEATPEESEELRLRKLPFSDFYQEVLDGKITDSLTVAAAYKVRIMQLEGTL